MLIRELFGQEIDRPINGVIKVGQQTDQTIKNELEEYIITRELKGYIDRFYSHFVSSLSKPTDQVGVWISGFFGSGKSHYLKILSYLLGNKPVDGKKPLEYFESKVEDPLLLANMQRASEVTGDVILFNIDSKADADSKRDKEAIVQVFMRVFDDHVGYFGTAPEIADLERRLAEQGKYELFQEIYEREARKTWQKDRAYWDFRADYILTALKESLGMSQKAAEDLYDNARKNYSLSVEKFSQIIQAYLQSKPASYRLIFMVDEVGQYIGDNPDLMLNLQTIAEDLGTHCGGQAWIAVTSQEDIESITKHKVRGNDFSKIQGRFKTRFHLSSANTDEVIKLRLLDKKPDVAESLEALYADKEQILKNHNRFSSGTADMPGYKNSEDFVRSYPFIPYQFGLLQKVLTQIREHGMTGKHLSQGERSMLAAFQDAAKQLMDQSVGTLIPFHAFYHSIEDFLDTSIKVAVTQATSNSRLEEFDIEILKTLFMIKWVKELKGTVENLVTLSLSHIDEDRVSLKTKIEKALSRLEKETLIQRNGDVYEFLTNEEQDVGREIKSTQVQSDEMLQELQKIVWEELYNGTRKYSYNQHNDYTLTRLLDDLSYGQAGDLTLYVITPYGDDYSRLQEDAAALLHSGSGSSVLVRLPNVSEPFNELFDYVRTDKYVKQKNRDGLNPSLVTILQTRASENNHRRARAVEAFEKLLVNADLFVGGKKLGRLGNTPKEVFAGGLKVFVENNYPKLGYLKSYFDNDKQLQQVLQAGSLQFNADGTHPNELAHEEMIRYLDNQQQRHQIVTLKTLGDHFTKPPYGWTERDAQGVLLELLKLNKVELKYQLNPVDLSKLEVSKMVTRGELDKYTLRVPRLVDTAALQLARNLAHDELSMANVPGEPQPLFDRYREYLKTKLENVTQHLTRVEQGGYPFGDELKRHKALLKDLLDTRGQH
jgi:hypothetical protein